MNNNNLSLETNFIYLFENIFHFCCCPVFIALLPFSSCFPFAGPHCGTQYFVCQQAVRGCMSVTQNGWTWLVGHQSAYGIGFGVSVSDTQKHTNFKCSHVFVADQCCCRPYICIYVFVYTVVWKVCYVLGTICSCSRKKTLKRAVFLLSTAISGSFRPHSRRWIDFLCNELLKAIHTLLAWWFYL